MSGLPWYAHDIKAYERKTAHLSMLEHGAYRLMMDHYYKTAAPLPASVEQVHRICRALEEAEQIACTCILHQFFVLEADGWHNIKVDEELSRMAELSGKRSKAAKTRHSKPPANVVHLHTHLTQTVTKKEKKKEPQAASISNSAVPIPDWVDREAWAAFLAMREKKKAPVTPRALELLLGKLNKWRVKGHDPTAILDASTVSAWKDLYEPKAEKPNGNRSPHERVYDVARDYCAEILAGGEGAQGGGADQTAVPLLPARPNGTTN